MLRKLKCLDTVCYVNDWLAVREARKKGMHYFHKYNTPIYKPKGQLWPSTCLIFPEDMNDKMDAEYLKHLINVDVRDVLENNLPYVNGGTVTDKPLVLPNLTDHEYFWDNGIHPCYCHSWMDVLNRKSDVVSIVNKLLECSDCRFEIEHSGDRLDEQFITFDDYVRCDKEHVYNIFRTGRIRARDVDYFCLNAKKLSQNDKDLLMMEMKRMNGLYIYTIMSQGTIHAKDVVRYGVDYRKLRKFDRDNVRQEMRDRRERILSHISNTSFRSGTPCRRRLLCKRR